MDALEVLPDYCWRHVFRDLDAEDLLRCRDVCKYFHRLLEEQLFQQKWKFHLILPDLFSQFETNEVDSPVTWGNLLTNIRLICKSWKKSLDKYASEEDDKFRTFSQSFLLMNKYPLINRFGTPGKIQEFQQAFGQVTTNPFPSRAVSIRDTAADEIRAMVNQEGIVFNEARRIWQEWLTIKVMELMEQFGKNIFRFELYFSSEGPGPVDLCKLIFKTSRHLPSMKIFAVGYGGQLTRYAKSNWIDEIDIYIKQNPLVDLLKLTTLQVQELPPQLEKYVLNKYSPQLAYLHRATLDNSIWQVGFLKFRNLTKLQLELVVKNGRGTLDALRLLRSPLKQLFLNISSVDQINISSWEIDKALLCIKHLPLECFGIEVINPMYIVESELYSPSVNDFNKGIKRFVISCYTGMSSFNFLQSLSNLRVLEIMLYAELVNPPNTENMPEAVIRLNEFILDGERRPGPLYKSNVWEMISSLKTLIVTRYHIRGDYNQFIRSTYTREGFESFKKNQSQSKIKEALEEVNLHQH